MAHARRKFENSKDNDPQRAEYVLECMQKLYMVEREVEPYSRLKESLTRIPDHSIQKLDELLPC
jgi:hypothetical protein